MNCQMFSKENIEEIKVAAFKSQYSLFKDDYLVYFVEGKDNISLEIIHYVVLFTYFV